MKKETGLLLTTNASMRILWELDYNQSWNVKIFLEKNEDDSTDYRDRLLDSYSQSFKSKTKAKEFLEKILPLCEQLLDIGSKIPRRDLKKDNLKEKMNNLFKDSK